MDKPLTIESLQADIDRLTAQLAEAHAKSSRDESALKAALELAERLQRRLEHSAEKANGQGADQSKEVEH